MLELALEAGDWQTDSALAICCPFRLCIGMQRSLAATSIARCGQERHGPALPSISLLVRVTRSRTSGSQRHAAGTTARHRIHPIHRMDECAIDVQRSQSNGFNTIQCIG